MYLIHFFQKAQTQKKKKKKIIYEDVPTSHNRLQYKAPILVLKPTHILDFW